MGFYTMLSGKQLLSLFKITGSGSITKLRQYSPSKPEELFTCQSGITSQKTRILKENFFTPSELPLNSQHEVLKTVYLSAKKKYCTFQK